MATDIKTDSKTIPSWARRAIIWFWLGGLGAFYAVGVVRALRTLMLVILVSLFLSFAIEPAVKRMEDHGIKRGYGTGIAFLGIIVVTFGILAMIGTALATEMQDLIDKLPDYIDDVQAWLNRTFNLDYDFDTLRQEFVDGGGIENLVSRFADDVVSVGATVVDLLFQVVTVALFTFYLVADGPKFRKLVSGFLGERRRDIVVEVWDLAIAKTGGYIYSRTALAAISAACHWVAFYFLDVPSPLALALWVGLVSQFIPAIGTYFAGALPFLIALLHHPRTGLWALIVVVLYQQIENYLLSPKITAQTMQIHVAVAFGSVMAGLALLGAVGALLALPTAATTQAFITSWRARAATTQPAVDNQPAADHDKPTTASESH